jgi:hypothetical protein
LNSHFIGLDVRNGLIFPVVPIAFLFTEADGTETSLSVITGLSAFLGATSDIGFGQLSLYSAGTSANTNFTIANVAVAPTPEPATLLLSGTTAAGLGLARWYQRRGRVRAHDA